MRTRVIMAVFIVVALILVGVAYYIIVPPASRKLGKIRFGTNPFTSGHYVPFIVAYEKGWFREAGIELDLYTFTSGTVHMNAVAAGELDMGEVGVAPVITAIDASVKIKIIYPYQCGGSLFVVRKGVPIYNVSDFIYYVSKNPGQFKFGTYPPGAIQYTILCSWLSSIGIDYEKDIDLITTVSPPDFPKLLQAGTLDGVFCSYGYVITPLEDGDARFIASSMDMWPNHACCCVYATDDFIREHTDVVKCFVDVLEKAIEWTNEHPSEAYKINADGGWFNEVSAELHLKYAQKSEILWLTPAQFEKISLYIQSTQKFCDTLYELGLIRHRLHEDDLFNWDYIK